MISAEVPPPHLEALAAVARECFVTIFEYLVVVACLLVL